LFTEILQLCAGVKKVDEFEYPRTVQSCRVNARYVASSFDGEVNVRVVQSTTVGHLSPVSTTRVDGPSTRLVETRARQHGPC